LACAAQFMVVLDVAVVNVAPASIQQDLGIGKSTLQWVIIAYGLMLGGFLLLGGRLADLLGRRRILMTGLVIFSAASLIAGFAGSPGILLVALAAFFRPADSGNRTGHRFDAGGAISVTAGLLLLVYAVNHGASSGWH